VVTLDQRQTTGEAPPFASVLSRPNFDTARIATFLLNPHPTMPDMSLTRIEAGALAAYIATLAKQRYAFPSVARDLAKMPNAAIFSFSIFFHFE